MLISEKLLNFRSALKSKNIDAYIIPSSDPHNGEYVADHWKSRAWVSGFTGSAGTFVASQKSAGIWTDSRYFTQAEKELDGSEIILHKVYNQGSPTFLDWIIENVHEGGTVGCDGSLFTKKQISIYQKKLKTKNIKLDFSHDLIKDIWVDRPAIPKNRLFELNIEYAGESRSSKIKRIRAKMSEYGSDLHLVSTLDDIAWIFNIRGTDVKYNPLVISYVLIEMEEATLFIDKEKVSEKIYSKFKDEGIDILPYNDIWAKLNNIDPDLSILIDENNINHKLYRAINTNHKVNRELPSIGMKAVKNVVEVQHFRNAMEKDGVALTRFYMWLEENIDNGPTEYELVQKIAHFRSLQEGYQSESFGAIVGYKGNGAIVHYSPPERGSSRIASSGVLLIDSGAQYLNGTTDITRTVSLGDVNEKEKNAYTRVLKGHIALDRAIYPEGTLGVQLDTLARVHLWSDKLNFLHGTGHGIGFFLNVHEGPQGFHPGIASRSKNSIDEHMVTTNEPGYYEDGEFGIRIENCLLTVKAGQSSSGSFLKFETLTLFPIDTSLIEKKLMTVDEIKWLNNYHKEVYLRLSPYLSEDERLWMAKKCEVI